MSVNDLYYTLKYAKNENGNYTLLVAHPNGTPNSYYNSIGAAKAKTRRAQTTEFVKWFRKSFPNTITEFRGITPHSRYNTKRYFIAYDVPPRDFMMIKLSKEYPMRELLIGYQAMGTLGGTHIDKSHTTPSEDYMNRQEAKVVRQEIKALNAEIVKKQERLKELGAQG